MGASWWNLNTQVNMIRTLTWNINSLVAEAVTRMSLISIWAPGPLIQLGWCQPFLKSSQVYTVTLCCGASSTKWTLYTLLYLSLEYALFQKIVLLKNGI